jgi:hypothetical protein
VLLLSVQSEEDNLMFSWAVTASVAALCIIVASNNLFAVHDSCNDSCLRRYRS